MPCGALDSAAIAPLDAPGGLIVAGMGGSSVGGRLAAAVLAPRPAPARWSSRWTTASRPGPGRTRWCCARATRAARRRRSRPTTRPRRPGAPRLVGHDRRAAGRAGARGRRAVVPLPGGFQPRPRSATRSSSRSRPPRCAARRRRVRDEVEGAAALAEALAAEWGPDRRRGQRGQAARARAARLVPGHHRRRADRARSHTAGSARSTRTPSCPPSPASCRSTTTTRSSAGPAPTAGCPRSSSRTRRPTRAPRCASRSRPSSPPSGAAAVERVPRPRRDAARAARVARAARRPRLDLPGRAARRRPRRTSRAIDTLKARLAAARAGPPRGRGRAA